MDSNADQMLKTSLRGETSFTSVPCANLIAFAGATVGNCPSKAYLTCNHCHLVQYCGVECQRQHWSQHKGSCKKSPLGKESWQPRWVTEGRQPAFITKGFSGPAPFGKSKYLWGNVPAFDLLNLKDNEGGNYQKDTKLCFAGSGDLRNFLLTVLGLPDSYDQKCVCILNDRDSDIVLRNMIMLITALSLPPDDASVAVLHLWYSARLPAPLLAKVLEKARPLVSEGCEKIKNKADSSLQSKTWTFGKVSLRVVLTKLEWKTIHHILETSFDGDKAELSRKAVVHAPSRVDYVDRQLFNMKPFARVGNMHYRTKGVLAPFGSDVSEFNRANPLLFSAAGEWLQKDSAGPFDGWHVKEVLDSGRARNFPVNDLYGKLACHVEMILRAFCTKVATTNLSVQLYQLDARRLPQFLEPNAFDRVEVSNLTDEGWLGVETVLRCLGPLLKHKVDNAHATLVGLFLNAVSETQTGEELRNKDKLLSAMLKAKQYIPVKLPLERNDPHFFRFSMAKDMFLDFDDLFDAHMHKVGFKYVAAKTGICMKEKHTIIDKWPFRLRQKAGTPLAQQEFDLLHASSLTGSERYMEWSRA